MVARLSRVREVAKARATEPPDEIRAPDAQEFVASTVNPLEHEETQFRRTHKNSERRFLKILFRDCPVEIALRVLGKKWAVYTLRDIGLYNIDRFSRLLESIPGISPKVLAT